MTRTILENEACPITSSKQDQGTGYVHFAPQTEKPTLAGIIDAEQYQDEFLTRLIRERAGDQKRQSRIIEVA
jgi:hypothetical protein